MEKDKLIDRKNATEAAFDSLAKEVKKDEDALDVKRSELTRLQGDFRTYEALIADWSDKKNSKEPPIVPEAVVIEKAVNA